MTGKNIEYLVCPEGHGVPYTPRNFAKDDSDGTVDAFGVPMHEDGLHCYSCDRPYGLSKLTEPRVKGEK
jgi:hypothetical protein